VREPISIPAKRMVLLIPEA